MVAPSFGRLPDNLGIAHGSDVVGISLKQKERLLALLAFAENSLGQATFSAGTDILAWHYSPGKPPQNYPFKGKKERFFHMKIMNFS